jgi:DnaJ-class molecular chaperone
MPLSEAIALFRRLGVNAEALDPRDFRHCYLNLVRRYHPDYNPKYHELMANINCARSTILQAKGKAQ